MANIEIPLDILDVNVIEVEITQRGEIIITVESTVQREPTVIYVAERLPNARVTVG